MFNVGRYRKILIVGYGAHKVQSMTYNSRVIIVMKEVTVVEELKRTVIHWLAKTVIHWLAN